MSVEIDELKLTAYALGELDDADDQAAVEGHLAGDGAAATAARRHVDEVRATAAVLADGLAREADRDEHLHPDEYRLTALQRAAIERRLAGERDPVRRPARAVPLRRNWALWGSLAASVLIVTTVTATVIVPLLKNAYSTHGAGGNPDGQPTTPADPSGGQRGLPPIVMLPGRGDAGGPRDGTEWPPITYAPVPGLGGLGGLGGPAERVAGEAGFVRADARPISAFPPSPVYPDDVDQGSMAALKRALARGHLPPADSVRTDELINAFPYSYPAPKPGDAVGASIEVAGCPWAADHRLVRIGVRAAGEASTGAAAGIASAAPVVARDVSIRVEFNPAVAAAYRLIGYETRTTAGAPGADDDFSGFADLADAPIRTLAAGRTVTALYEVIPVGQPAQAANAAAGEGLKYQKVTLTPTGSGEMLTVSVRYRPAAAPATRPATVPAADAARSVEVAATDAGTAFDAASGDFKQAAAAAAFGLVLRGSPHRGRATLDLAAQLAEQSGTGRGELADLVKKAKAAGGRAAGA